MTNPTPTRRRFYPTPAWLIYGLLVVEGLLWLSERYQWFWFNEMKGWTVLIGVAVVGAVMLGMLLWFIVALIFRWRVQYSIRSILIAVVGIVVPCSWMAIEMEKAREQREAFAPITQVGGDVVYDWHCDVKGDYIFNAEPPGPTWLRNLLGDAFFGSAVRAVLSGTQITDAELAHVGGLNKLHSLFLDFTQVTDAGLQHLGGLNQLHILSLIGTRITDTGLQYIGGPNQLQVLLLVQTQITDAGLVHLRRLSQLESLYLNNTKITDAGLPNIAGLTQLQTLYLISTQITDIGLKKLKGLNQLHSLNLAFTQVTDSGLNDLEGLGQLQFLDLRGTKVTDAGVKKLQQALPDCMITH